MRVSYFFGGSLPSSLAAPIQILHTARALCDLGVEVTLFAGLLGAPPSSLLAAYGLTPHPLLAIRPCPSRLDKLLALLSTRDRRDLLIVRGEPGTRILALLGPLAPRYILEAHRLAFTDAPAVLAQTLRDGRPPRELRRAFSREAGIMKRAAGLIFLTRGLEDAVRSLYAPAGAALVLPSGASPADAGTTTRDIDVLYAGKLVARKGVGDLIRAMRHLEGLRLVLLGDRAARESDDVDLEALARAEGVAARVTFAGPVAPAEMASWWRRARVGVCPLPAGQSLVAERFTSPLKVMEMMACAVPIVATDVPSMRELLSHDETALLARPNDPASLAACIRAVHERADLAARLTAAARQRASERSWQWRARTLLDFLRART